MTDSKRATKMAWLGHAVVASAMLTACAVGPTYAPPVLPIVAAWQAKLPHEGSVAELAGWWARWNDATLTALINAAQANNPSLEQASARIRQARAGQVISGASALPAATGALSANSGNTGVGIGQGRTSSIGASLQAAWELDLFGANRRGREAADARFSARQIDWHQARVSLAAELATTYVNLRVNEALVGGFVRDGASRNETARLTRLKTDAGFEAPANAALASAGAAEAGARLSAQRAEFDLGVKALVALSGLPENSVRVLLDASHAPIPTAAILGVDRVPAAILAQRPDLASAERELAALSAEIGAAEADRYPRISLTGSISVSVARMAAVSSDGASWGFGPSISIPLFDSGRRLAQVDLVRARYDEALAAYKAVATRAVREVEEALTQLQSARLRAPDLQAARVGYQAFERAAQARLSAGAGSVLELEEARRLVLAAEVALLSLERERLNASISLYRAMGGGWDQSQTDAQTTAAPRLSEKK